MNQSRILHVSDTSFHDEVVQSDKPMLEEVAAERQDSLRVVKINVDESPEVARQFGIRSIPTLMLFQDGKSQAQRVGSLRRVELEAFLDS